MPAAGPTRQLDPTPPPGSSRTRILSLEATGMIIIAVIILILAVVRYWRHIPWGLR